MAIRPTQPQRVDSVLDTAVKLSKASVVKVLPLSLLMALVSMPGSIYLFVKGGVDLSDPFGMIRLMLSPGYLLVSIAVCIGMLLIVAAVSLRMAAIASDGDMSTTAALLKALRHLPSLLVSLVLYLVVVLIGPFLLTVPTLMSRSNALAVSLGVLLTIVSNRSYRQPAAVRRYESVREQGPDRGADRESPPGLGQVVAYQCGPGHRNARAHRDLRDRRVARRRGRGRASARRR